MHTRFPRSVAIVSLATASCGGGADTTLNDALG